MDVVDLAWAAGVFEASGRAYVPPDGSGLRVSVKAPKLDTLLRFSLAVECEGAIRKRGSNYEWRIQKREEAMRVLLRLKPYLSSSTNTEKIEERAQAWVS